MLQMNAYSVGIIDVFSEGVAEQVKFISKRHHGPILEAKGREERLPSADVCDVLDGKDVHLLEIGGCASCSFVLVRIALEIFLLLLLFLLHLLLFFFLGFFLQCSFLCSFFLLFAFRRGSSGGGRCCGGGGGGSGLLLGLRLFLRLLGGRESGALGLSRLLLGSLLRDEGLVAVGLGVPGLKGLLPLPEPSVEPLSGFDVLDTGGRLQLLLPLLHEGLAGALLGPVKGNLIEAFVFLRERKFHEVCVKGVGGEVGDLQLPERPLLLFVCQLSSRGIFIHGVLLRSLLGSGVLGAGVRHDGLELLGVLGFLLFHLLLC
mmetsp:Transcript_19018/g.40906  ORF Transcript_19018/g.40906 Transcript_19018/m.40906 type:complete len:317 (+) Transcript_19018:579-1529(+)